MPLKALRPCPQPGCPALTRGGPCVEHAKEREAIRGTSAQRGYGGDWTAYAHAWLQRFPWCGQRQDGQLYAEHSRCVQRGERNRAQCTDHIVSLRNGGAHMSPANSQSLCTSCNTAKDAPRK